MLPAFPGRNPKLFGDLQSFSDLTDFSRKLPKSIRPLLHLDNYVLLLTKGRIRRVHLNSPVYIMVSLTSFVYKLATVKLIYNEMLGNMKITLLNTKVVT